MIEFIVITCTEKREEFSLIKIPKREEIPEKYQWDLTDLFANREEWEEARAESYQLLVELKEELENVTTSSSNLFAFLQKRDTLNEKFEKVIVYSFLIQDENTKDSKRQELEQKLTSTSLLYSEIESAFHTKFLTLDEKMLNNYYKEEEGLLFYRKYFEDLLRMKPHTLSEEQEYILSQTSLLNSSEDIYEMLGDADLTFPSVKDEEGKEIELTQGNFTELMENENREIRIQAFKNFYSTFKQFENTFAETLYSSNKADRFYATIKKFNSSLEMGVFDDHVPEEVYNNLIQTVKDNMAPMEKYLNLRKEMLGVEELHMYDIYAPLVKEVEMKITYEEAYETMKKALAVLGDEYIETVSKAYGARWIDVYENEGKRSGAYQTGAYGVHPYILLNHKDNLDNMFTLVHEMGHAMHSYFSDKHNAQLYASYSIFVAEVASTVNEVLLMKYLLQHTEDKKTKQYLITYFLEQFRTTLFRQTMFAEFEKITHERVEEDEPLTAEVLSAIYYDLNKQYYGSQVVHDEEIAIEWARIPHFYDSFYVYKYATGFSAAIALADQILEEGAPAVERYLEFLKSGGTDFPIELLKKAGVDLSSPKPVEEALDVFRQLVDELEQLK